MIRKIGGYVFIPVIGIKLGRQNQLLLALSQVSGNKNLQIRIFLLGLTDSVLKSRLPQGRKMLQYCADCSESVLEHS